jgi:hypothetical protein
MTAPVPPTSEPDTSARTCPGDRIGPCSTCHRPTRKYGSGARFPLCELRRQGSPALGEDAPRHLSRAER